jgi:hypothetical protein
VLDLQLKVRDAEKDLIGVLNTATKQLAARDTVKTAPTTAHKGDETTPQKRRGDAPGHRSVQRVD